VSDTARRRLVAGCAALAGGLLLVCLGAMAAVMAWLKLPGLYGSADFIYACAGVNVARLLFGAGWNSNLAGLTPVYVAFPQVACGYFPRPPFLPPYGLWIFKP